MGLSRGVWGVTWVYLGSAGCKIGPNSGVRGVWGVTWVYLGSAGCKIGPNSGVRGVMALR